MDFLKKKLFKGPKLDLSVFLRTMDFHSNVKEPRVGFSD